MPSAAQKQRRRKLKQKKEHKKEDRRWWRGQQERLAAAVVRASDEWGPHPDECSPSERAHFRQFIYLLYNAFEEIAWDLATHEPLDEEEVKEEMEVMIHEVTTFTGDVQIEDIEKYEGFITHATAVYNSLQGTNAATAPAASPTPVAETAEELRRRAKGLTKKLNAVTDLQARVDAGLDPNAQQVEKLARRGELEEELSAVTEALAVLPPLARREPGSWLPDYDFPVLADSVLGRLVAAAAAAAPPAAAPRPSDVQQSVGATPAERRVPERQADDIARAGAEAVQRELDMRRERAAAARARDQERREREAFVAARERTPPEARERYERRERERAAAAEDAAALRGRQIARQIIAEDAAARRIMAEEAAARESARAAAVPRPSAPVPPPAPPPAPAVAAPPPAPRPPPRPAAAAPPPTPAATPPENLMCPISIDLLVDPVFAADGHTYSRAEIQAWLDTGKRTSPKTNEPLAHTILTPNHLARSMVQEYLDAAKKG
jgi:hypothetical protein